MNLEQKEINYNKVHILSLKEKMETGFLLVLLFITINLFPTSVSSASGADVNSLLTKLFVTNNYNKNVRPLADQDEIVAIRVDFFLNSVIDFDEQEESLKTSGYLKLFWIDDYLTWTPADENNISALFVPQDNIWKPDISLRNTLKTFTGLGSSYLNVFVLHTGIVEWNPYQVLESTCSVDITFFPFDTQICELKFTAWSYLMDDVVIVKGSNGVQLEDYVENSQWELAETSARETNTDETAVFFSLKLKRRPNYYIINVILPIIFLSCLNAFAFVLPVSSGERAGYAVTVFLSLAVYMTIVAGELPRNSENVSLLAIYLMLIISLSTAIVMVSIVEVRLAARDENKQPVGYFFFYFVKTINCFTCKKCRKSVGPADVSKSNASLHTLPDDSGNITWEEVVEDIDIFCFWFSLLFTILCTMVLSVVAITLGQ